MASNQRVDYDELLSSAGKFGKYQLYLFLVTGPFYIAELFAYTSQIFITQASPNHWCRVPELENLTAIERRTLAIPTDPTSHFGYSHCTVYSANWTEVLLTGQRPNDTWATEPCQYGWEFNSTEIPYATITSDLGWVCEKNSYAATAQSIFFMGSIVGGFLIGWISDKYGRLPAATISNMIGFFAGIVTIFAKDIIQFSVFRFIMGMCYDSCMMMAYLLVLEYVSPKYRTIIANLPFAIYFTLASTLVPWIALACDHWKTFSVALSVPMGLCMFAPFILPESPRWLLSKNRVDEAVSKIVTIGVVNGKTVPPKLIEEFKLSVANQKQENNVTCLELFKRPRLRRVFVSMCVAYMCCVIVFDALLRSIGSLGFDFFLSFTLISLTELPSLLLMSFVLDITGRKLMSIVTLSVCAVFSVLIAFLDGGLSSVLCAIVARFAVNIANNAAIQWCAEIVPTSVRGSAGSFVHICGYLATCLSPYIVYLENYVPWLPLVIVSLVSVLGIVCSLVIPETAGYDMPHTFDDAEGMIASQKFMDVPFLRKFKCDEKIGGEINM